MVGNRCAFSPTDRMGNLVRGTHLREGEAGHNVLLVGTMEGTQRSQPISTENQEIAKQAACETGQSSAISWENRPLVLAGESSLEWIRMLARKEPEMVFTSLAHRIDLDLLKQSFRKIRKNDSIGVDKVTAREYGLNLEENLYNLHQRLLRGQYVAAPVKRVWIDKEGGKKRPIGITALEDKIVQKAVTIILDAVYDADFYDFSHAFREDHGQHGAISEIRESCVRLNVGWIVSADISGLFDNIEHNHLRSMIKRRVNDGGILRLIGKWLNAGVMEEGNLSYPGKGTPQGGVISPVLSNIFLHYVLDDWFVKEVKPRMKGRCFIIRYADDFILGFELESDVQRVMEVLPKRFNRYGLSLHPEKTKVIPFRKPAFNKKGKGPGTFDFLGFTFYWSKSRKGYWVLKKKTIGKRLSRFMKELWQWCRRHRHDKIEDQHGRLTSKLRGYFNYFGVRGNFKALEIVFKHAEKAWKFWLSRRSHKGGINWKRFALIQAAFPFPKPRIVHKNI